MLNLRVYRRIVTEWNWDERDGCYYSRSRQSESLQAQDESSGEWFDVPVVVSHVGKEPPEDYYTRKPVRWSPC